MDNTHLAINMIYYYPKLVHTKVTKKSSNNNTIVPTYLKESYAQNWLAAPLPDSNEGGKN